MKKIKVKIINCSVYYNNKEYKKDEILEIDERFFRDDCMEKENELESKTEKNIDKEISKENLENYPLTIKELKEFSKNNFQIELVSTKKVEIYQEAKEKFEEKNLNLDEEIKTFKESKEV